MKGKSKRANPRRAGWVVMAVAAVVAALIGWMVINASLVQLRRASVHVPDLPAAFEGRTILYISDVDLCGLNTSERAAEAILQLQRLNPDMLILGGDYTSPTLGEVLNGRPDKENMLRNREAFFQALSDFNAPMGKYAMACREDAAIGDISTTLQNAGFTELNDNRRQFTLSGQKLWLVGVDLDAKNLSSLGRSFQRGECVVCVAETPDCLPRVTTSEAADGGGWADLCLTGHTHGGQIVILGRSVLNLTALEQQFRYGWTREGGAPMLTSSGLGCEGVNLRLGTSPEVWLITLHKK